MNSEVNNKVAILEGILSNVGACIFTKDTQGRYTYANQAVLDIFDLSLDQVLGKDDSHFFDLAKSKALIENDQIVMKTGQTLETEETNFVKAFNEERTYQIVKKPIYDENHDVIGVSGIATDVTEQRKLQRKLAEQNQLLDIVLNNVAAHIYMKDEERRFLYVNKKVAELFKLPIEHVVGQKEQHILDPVLAEHFHQSDAKLFETGEKQTVEETIEDDLGNRHHYLSVKVPFEQDGKKALIGFSTEVTELYELKEQFRKQANTDYLTGLYNRRYFVETAEREFKRAVRHKMPFALISLDIDYFKQVNDLYGHPTGDEVLKFVAENLSANIRDEDVLARIGGEEFAIMLPNTGFDEAFSVAERIRYFQELNGAKTQYGEIEARVSLGLAVRNETDDTFEHLFLRVDKALYQAKDQGRNRVIAHR